MRFLTCRHPPSGQGPLDRFSPFHVLLDLKRPFKASAVRLREAGFVPWLFAGLGLFPTRDQRLERALRVRQKQASLSQSIAFLARTQKIFQLWHVIHRPFSYAFANPCHSAHRYRACSWATGCRHSDEGQWENLPRRPIQPSPVSRLDVPGKDFRMKRIALALGFFAALFAVGGCKKQQNDNDAIRAGIMQHLTGVGTLNMSAMVMDIQRFPSTAIKHTPKLNSGPRPGLPRGLACRFLITWKSATAPGSFSKRRRRVAMIQHPDPNQNPHQNQDVHSGGLPRFNDVLNPVAAPAQGSLPPGHPPASHNRPLRSWARRIKLQQKNHSNFMDTLVAFIVAVIVIGLFLRSYLKKQKREEELALAAEEKGKMRSDRLRSMPRHRPMATCAWLRGHAHVWPDGRCWDVAAAYRNASSPFPQRRGPVLLPASASLNKSARRGR